jgi:hypothetical protein
MPQRGQSVSTPDPITLQAIDNEGNVLFRHSVPFSSGVSVRQLLEQAFIEAQSVQDADPFVFTLEFYGYSESAQFPGYLGYEIESIGKFANGGEFFWDLMVEDISVPSGADTTFPAPGAVVTWKYTAIVAAAASSKRAAAVNNRRAARAR